MLFRRSRQNSYLTCIRVRLQQLRPYHYCAYSDTFSGSSQSILLVCNDSCKVLFTIWNVSSLEMYSHHTNVLWPNRNVAKRPSVGPWQAWRKNGIEDCAIISIAGKSLYGFYCTVLGIATVVNLIDCLSGAVCKLSNNKISSTRLWKSMRLLLRSIAKMGRKWQNLQ